MKAVLLFLWLTFIAMVASSVQAVGPNLLRLGWSTHLVLLGLVVAVFAILVHLTRSFWK